MRVVCAVSSKKWNSISLFRKRKIVFDTRKPNWIFFLFWVGYFFSKFVMKIWHFLEIFLIILYYFHFFFLELF